MTQGWINNGRICIVGWTIHLTLMVTIVCHCMENLRKDSSKTLIPLNRESHTGSKHLMVDWIITKWKTFLLLFFWPCVFHNPSGLQRHLKIDGGGRQTNIRPARHNADRSIFAPHLYCFCACARVDNYFGRCSCSQALFKLNLSSQQGRKGAEIWSISLLLNATLFLLFIALHLTFTG